MGRKLPRRESAILLIATSETRLGDTNVKTGAWYVPLFDVEGIVLKPFEFAAAYTPMPKGQIPNSHLRHSLCGTVQGRDSRRAILYLS